MSPKFTSITDQQSESGNIRRGRPSAPPSSILAAADALFAGSNTPVKVSMDAIAVAAGVGKGTLFRAFGSRDGLLDQLWEAKLSVLKDAVEGGHPPYDAAVPAKQQVVAFLDALLIFKLQNRHLIRARETAPKLLRSAHYRWMRGVVRGLIEKASLRATADDTLYVANALLAALHIDLIEEMMADGLSLEAIRHAQAMQATAAIDRFRAA